MISIIICSRGNDIPNELRQSIASTIDCYYELVIIDNSASKYSIFEAYNEGVRIAKGDILCFIHEDVVFHSSGWGRIISSHLSNHKEVGAIGFLGGHYLPSRPCYWSEPRVESAHYIQGETLDGVYSSRRINHQKYRQSRTFVAAIDGVFMAMPKSVFDELGVRWDDSSYSGFHFYDADMCMQIHNAGLKIEILWDVWMEHKSCGNTVDAFLEARQIWFKKWQSYLPLVCGVEMTDEDIDICRIIMDITDQSYQYSRIRRSLAYRLGKALLHPSRVNIQSLFHNNDT